MCLPFGRSIILEKFGLTFFHSLPFKEKEREKFKTVINYDYQQVLSETAVSWANHL